MTPPPFICEGITRQNNNSTHCIALPYAQCPKALDGEQGFVEFLIATWDFTGGLPLLYLIPSGLQLQFSSCMKDTNPGLHSMLSHATILCVCTLTVILPMCLFVHCAEGVRTSSKRQQFYCSPVTFLNKCICLLLAIKALEKEMQGLFPLLSLKHGIMFKGGTGSPDTESGPTSTSRAVIPCSLLTIGSQLFVCH